MTRFAVTIALLVVATTFARAQIPSADAFPLLGLVDPNAVPSGAHADAEPSSSPACFTFADVAEQTFVRCWTQAATCYLELLPSYLTELQSFAVQLAPCIQAYAASPQQAATDARCTSINATAQRLQSLWDGACDCYPGVAQCFCETAGRCATQRSLDVYDAYAANCPRLSPQHFVCEDKRPSVGGDALEDFEALVAKVANITAANWQRVVDRIESEGWAVVLGDIAAAVQRRVATRRVALDSLFEAATPVLDTANEVLGSVKWQPEALDALRGAVACAAHGAEVALDASNTMLQLTGADEDAAARLAESFERSLTARALEHHPVHAFIEMSLLVECTERATEAVRAARLAATYEFCADVADARVLWESRDSMAFWFYNLTADDWQPVGWDYVPTFTSFVDSGLELVKTVCTRNDHLSTYTVAVGKPVALNGIAELEPVREIKYVFTVRSAIDKSKLTGARLDCGDAEHVRARVSSKRGKLVVRRGIYPFSKSVECRLFTPDAPELTALLAETPLTLDVPDDATVERVSRRINVAERATVNFVVRDAAGDAIVGARVLCAGGSVRDTSNRRGRVSLTLARSEHAVCIVRATGFEPSVELFKPRKESQSRKVTLAVAA